MKGLPSKLGEAARRRFEPSPSWRSGPDALGTTPGLRPRCREPRPCGGIPSIGDGGTPSTGAGGTPATGGIPSTGVGGPPRRESLPCGSTSPPVRLADAGPRHPDVRPRHPESPGSLRALPKALLGDRRRSPGLGRGERRGSPTTSVGGGGGGGGGVVISVGDEEQPAEPTVPPVMAASVTPGQRVNVFTSARRCSALRPEYVGGASAKVCRRRSKTTCSVRPAPNPAVSQR